MQSGKYDEDGLTLKLGGRHDTTTAPQLEAEIRAFLEGIKDLVLDFEKLDYLSSAGLRVMAELKMSDYGISPAEFETMAKNAKSTMGGLFPFDRVEFDLAACVNVYEKSYK